MCVTHSSCEESDEGKTCSCFEGFVADDASGQCSESDSLNEFKSGCPRVYYVTDELFGTSRSFLLSIVYHDPPKSRESLESVAIFFKVSFMRKNWFEGTPNENLFDLIFSILIRIPNKSSELIKWTKNCSKLCSFDKWKLRFQAE